jgi:hypothetical protein
MPRQPAVAKPLACTGAPTATGLQLADAEASPLFAMLQTKFGPPHACQVSDSDAGREIRVDFPGGARLMFTASEAIESSAQEASWPLAAALPGADALHVLRKVEAQAASPNGCGIAWAKLEAKHGPGTEDLAVTGTSCNCRAHMSIDHGKITGLGFSLAC